MPEHRSRRLSRVDFEVKLEDESSRSSGTLGRVPLRPGFTDSEEVNGGTLCQVSLRPGLTDFFEWVRWRRSQGLLQGPWLFTQGVNVYVEPVLRKLDPTGDIFSDRVLTKDSCTALKTPGYVLKDLGSVTEAASASNAGCQISQVVLVDNNSVSAILHPQNTLLVRDWRGDGKPDTELNRVSTSLDSLLSHMCQGDHGLEPGDYAGLLAQRTSELLAFCEDLRVLRELLDTEPTKGQLKQQLTRAWDLSCSSKQKLLGLAQGEH